MARQNEKQLQDAVIAALPNTGEKVLYSEFLQSLQDSGNAAAASLLLAMKHGGQIVYELRPNPDNASRSDLFVGVSEANITS